jgi:hypothetical protein
MPLAEGFDVMKIRVLERNVYGRDMLYPAPTDGQGATLLCDLVGKLTLSLDDLRKAHALGHLIEAEWASPATLKAIAKINAMPTPPIAVVTPR